MSMNKDRKGGILFGFIIDVQTLIANEKVFTIKFIKTYLSQ